MKRRFKNLRSDHVLDVRQFEAALRRLRVLTREGSQSELDLEETIDQTAKNCGDIEVVMRRPRKNDVKLVLLMDVGGSMTTYSRLTSLLFSAAHKATHFKAFKSFFFHNCPYETLYTDITRREGSPTLEVLGQFDKTWRCIVVGDAAMAPYELLEPGGSVDYFHRNREAGVRWLQRIGEAVPRTVWLNPEPSHYWEHTYTTRVIASLFEMFPLTLDGIEDAMNFLRSVPTS
jgi:uncharacterized protein